MEKMKVRDPLINFLGEPIERVSLDSAANYTNPKSQGV
jgi:hypothetical protein